MKLHLNGAALLGLLKKNISLPLSLVLVMVIILEAFVIQSSVNMVLQVKNQVPNIQTKIVRVNVAKYGEIEKQFTQNGLFLSGPVTTADPFGKAPEKKN